MAITNQVLSGFFRFCRATPLYLRIRRGDLLSLQATFIDKLTAVLFGLRFVAEKPIVFDIEERSILTPVTNSRRENKNKLTAKSFFEEFRIGTPFFLKSNYTLFFLCIIIIGLLIVSVQHNERAYHGDEDWQYLRSAL